MIPTTRQVSSLNEFLEHLENDLEIVQRNSRGKVVFISREMRITVEIATGYARKISSLPSVLDLTYNLNQESAPPRGYSNDSYNPYTSMGRPSCFFCPCLSKKEIEHTLYHVEARNLQHFDSTKIKLSKLLNERMNALN